MGKLKTRKSILKRVKITGQKKLLRRRPGQDHFNAKETGDASRRKKEDVGIFGKNAKTLKRQLPYN